MKMTLVIDTDDASGIEDAFKMVSIMKERRGENRHHAGLGGLTIGKIALIKALRAFAKEQAKRDLEDPSRTVGNLRDAKLFAERLIANDGKLSSLT